MEQDACTQFSAGIGLALRFGELSVVGDLNDGIALSSFKSGNLKFEDHISLFPEVAHSGKIFFTFDKNDGLKHIAFFHVRHHAGGDIEHRRRERSHRGDFGAFELFALHDHIFSKGDQV